MNFSNSTLIHAVGRGMLLLVMPRRSNSQKLPYSVSRCDNEKDRSKEFVPGRRDVQVGKSATSTEKLALDGICSLTDAGFFSVCVTSRYSCFYSTARRVALPRRSIKAIAKTI